MTCEKRPAINGTLFVLFRLRRKYADGRALWRDAGISPRMDAEDAFRRGVLGWRNVHYFQVILPVNIAACPLPNSGAQFTMLPIYAKVFESRP